jgi:hypothetical protein
MPHDHSVADLERCIKGCKTDQVCVKACEDAFEAAGGKVFTQDGGKVFTDRDGGKVFIPNPK